MPDRSLAEGSLNAAKALIDHSGKKKPQQAMLRRAISSCYYAVFHGVACACANSFIGSGSSYPRKAWVEVYRGLEHGVAKAACLDIPKRSINFPQPLIDVADGFVQLQALRHVADYDPLFRTSKPEVEDLIKLTKSTLDALKKASQADRKAFAAWVLIKSHGANDSRKRRGQRSI